MITRHPLTAALAATSIGLLSALACAQETATAYVTDVLRLGLHAAEDTSDRAFRSLESGQQMQVLSRNRSYAQIRLPDGTQGYVKAAYLVDEKPARLIVDEVRSDAVKVSEELASVRAAFSGSAERIANLEQALSDSQSEAEQAIVDYQQAKADNADYERKMKLYGFSLPWPIALGAMLVMLALGFVGGYWWIDSRSRKRHGGFRIY